MKISPELILQSVCYEYGITRTELTGKRRLGTVREARSIAALLLREHTDCLFSEIATLLGYEHHTTAVSACQAAQQRIASSKAIASMVERILTRCRKVLGNKTERQGKKSGKLVLEKASILPILRSYKLSAPRSPGITVHIIVRATSAVFGVRPKGVLGKSQKPVFVRPRRIAMLITLMECGKSLNELGALFGGKHHTTVFHALFIAERERRRDPEIQEKILRIRADLRIMHS